MTLVSEKNPFSGMPLETADENLRKQVRELRQHPLFGQEIPRDVTLLMPTQQLAFLELLAREEAIRLLRGRFRRSRLPIPYDVSLPLRLIDDSDWRGMLVRLPALFAKWKTEYAIKQEGRAVYPLPDVVEIIIREDFLPQASAELFPSAGKSTLTGRRKLALSPKDQKLYRDLKHENIATYTNGELWKTNRFSLGLRRDGYGAFRAQLYRIRTSYNLPSSKSISNLRNKSVQPKTPERSKVFKK